MLDILEEFIEHNREIKPNFLEGKNLEELLNKSVKALEFEIVNFAKEGLPLFCVLYKKFEDSENFGIYSLLPLAHIVKVIVEAKESEKEDEIEVYVRPMFREVYEDLLDTIVVLGVNKHRIIIPNEEEFNNKEKLEELYKKIIKLTKETLLREINRREFAKSIKKN